MNHLMKQYSIMFHIIEKITSRKEHANQLPSASSPYEINTQWFSDFSALCESKKVCVTTSCSHPKCVRHFKSDMAASRSFVLQWFTFTFWLAGTGMPSDSSRCWGSLCKICQWHKYETFDVSETSLYLDFFALFMNVARSLLNFKSPPIPKVRKYRRFLFFKKHV